MDVEGSESTPLCAEPDDLPNETEVLLSPGDVERGESSMYGSVTPPVPVKRLSVAKRVKYYVPSTEWIPTYSLQSLGGDVLAGVTVASMLIPQSVSYASSLAGLSPVTGLFSASVPGIIYALLGTCRQLNVAPEAALSLLVGQAIADVVHHDNIPHKQREEVGLAVATVITVQVGLITFVLGFLRLGFIDVLLSRALLRGFLTAIAVVIMIEQLVPMLGLTTLYRALRPHSTLDKIHFLITNAWQHAHAETVLISFVSLLTLVLVRASKNVFKRWWWIYRLPEVLLVVVVSTLLSREFAWDRAGVDILGPVSIKASSSFFQFPIRGTNIHFLRQTTSTAVLISVLGFLDSIVSAKQNSGRFGYSISPNRELVALGAANLAGSFIPGTLPAYGSITRSRINADVGATTQMASLACSAIVLLVTFFLLPSMYYLPRCVLASVICLVVISLLSETPHDVAYYWKMDAWIDLALMLLTFAFSIIWDIEVGIVVSVIISLLLVVHRSSKARLTILGRVPGTTSWRPINEEPEAEEDLGALIVRVRENLDFANTAQLKERLRRLELYGHAPRHPSEAPRRPHAKLLVFHLADMESCDASAILILYELFEMYKNRGVSLYVTHLRDSMRVLFERGGIVELLGEQAFCVNVGDAVSGYRTTHP